MKLVLLATGFVNLRQKAVGYKPTASIQDGYSLFQVRINEKEENYEKIMCDSFGGDVVGITFFGSTRSGDFGDTNSGYFGDIRFIGYEARNAF
jgi:hypothetical protein